MTTFAELLADRTHKIVREGECIVWTGARNDAGYGRIWLHQKKWAAHRLAYTLAVGPIPVGMTIDHLCHNRACFNPEHLRLADQGQNSRHRSGLNANNKSGVRGVYWHRANKKWCASIHIDGKQTVLGHYTDLAEAERVITAARATYYREFAGKG